MNKLFKILIFLLLFIGCNGTHEEYLYSNILKTPIKNIEILYIPYKDNSGYKWKYDFIDSQMKWKYVTDITYENYIIDIHTNISNFHLEGIKWKNLYNQIKQSEDLNKELYYTVVTILTKNKNNDIIYRNTEYKFLDLKIRKYNISEVESE